MTAQLLELFGGEDAFPLLCVYMWRVEEYELMPPASQSVSRMNKWRVHATRIHGLLTWSHNTLLT